MDEICGVEIHFLEAGGLGFYFVTLRHTFNTIGDSTYVSRQSY